MSMGILVVCVPTHFTEVPPKNPNHRPTTYLRAETIVLKLGCLIALSHFLEGDFWA